MGARHQGGRGALRPRREGVAAASSLSGCAFPGFGSAQVGTGNPGLPDLGLPCQASGVRWLGM